MLAQLARRLRQAWLGLGPLEYPIRGAPGLQLHQEYDGDVFLVSGLMVWPAAPVLAEYLLGRDDGRAMRGQSLLELGAGTGALGLACGIAEASRVVLSDRLVVRDTPRTYGSDGEVELGGSGRPLGRRQLELLARNVEINRPLLAGDMVVAELDFDAADGEARAGKAGEREVPVRRTRGAAYGPSGEERVHLGDSTQLTQMPKPSEFNERPPPLRWPAATARSTSWWAATSPTTARPTPPWLPGETRKRAPQKVLWSGSFQTSPVSRSRRFSTPLSDPTGVLSPRPAAWRSSTPRAPAAGARSRSQQSPQGNERGAMNGF